MPWLTAEDVKYVPEPHGRRTESSTLIRMKPSIHNVNHIAKCMFRATVFCQKTAGLWNGLDIVSC